MMSDRFTAELRAVLQAQHHILQQLDTAVSKMEYQFSDVSEQAEQLRELEQLMAELEDSVDFLEAEDLSDFNPDEIAQIYEEKKAAISHDLLRIGFKDWDSFVRQCQIYTLSQGIDPLTPYESLLTEKDLEQLKAESYGAQYRWDKWDYTFVGASGILASLTDFMLVGIPQTMTSGEYIGQVGNPITAWLKQYDATRSKDWFAQWAQHLSEVCKVPYDAMSYTSPEGFERIAGMNPRAHRLQSLGHDPVLGFVFGVLDIMRGTITGFSYDRLTRNHTWVKEVVRSNYEPVGLIEAILKQMGHLISDVATPMGLPAPFMTLVQGINVGSFGEKNRTVGEIARWMYLYGYDFRHFLVSGLTPATVEIFLRAYMMLRHYSEHGETKFDLASHPKYRTMLLTAHGIATLGNAGKIALMQGNPLAVNSAQWFAMIRYLIPNLKYWVFDQHRLQIEHLEHINDDAWDQLLENNDQILEKVTKVDPSTITLGT